MQKRDALLAASRYARMAAFEGRRAPHLMARVATGIVVIVSSSLFPCPCCGYPTLSEEPPGTYAICEVCGWEDDPVQYRDPSYPGGANILSLNEARDSFATTGASDPESRGRVRSPTDEEKRNRVTRPRN